MSSFVFSYPNERSRFTTSNTIYAYMRESGGLDISTFLDMDSVEAREKFWKVVMSYVDKKKYRIAGMVKVYLKSLYDYTHELRRDNQVILWIRRHQVQDIKSRKTEVPNHPQIYRLADTTTHLKTQSIILLSYSRLEDIGAETPTTKPKTTATKAMVEATTIIFLCNISPPYNLSLGKSV